MDLAFIGWVSLGWLLASVVVSLVVGRMFQHGDVTENDLEMAAQRHQVVRYLRSHNRHAPKTAKTAKAVPSGHRKAVM